jgi:hypothetical protein
MKRTGPSLSEIPRHELIAAALELGIERPELLSPEQLREKIRAASADAAAESDMGRVSLFSVARNLIASVVERGLNLPDAARVIRDTVRSSPRHRPPLPTVTLAQIYLAQGYTDRAIQTLVQVIEREPNNYTAAQLHQRLTRPVDEAADGRTSSEGAASEHQPSGVAQGTAPPSDLWFTPDRPPTRGLRDALVLIEREPKQITVYWELSDRHAAELGKHPCDVRVLCFGASTPREIVLPVRGSVGWALVELLDNELPRACLEVGDITVASAIYIRPSSSPNFDDETLAPPAELVFTCRSRGFWSDVVQRALG